MDTITHSFTQAGQSDRTDTLNTLDKEEFLTVNGIQTLSHSYLNLLDDLEDMKEMGVTHFRLVPHTQDIVAVANIFRDALDNTVSADESGEKLATLEIPAPFSNGFWKGRPGHQWVAGVTVPKVTKYSS